tara:strand:+ start:1141 stop:1602 length:462 start_codon:yes stop_codon:yes gene_type:complete
MPFTESLYHFTDSRNIPNIKKHGLYSFAALKAKLNLDYGTDFYPASSESSREIDFRKNLHNYIRLCSEQNHPMVSIALNENRINSVSWIKLDFSEIVFKNNFRENHILFSNINAASNNAIVDGNYSTFTQSHDIQKEVLVRFNIPLSQLEFIK